MEKNVQLGTWGHDPSGGSRPPPNPRGQRICSVLAPTACMEISIVSSDRSHRADRFRAIESSAAQI